MHASHIFHQRLQRISDRRNRRARPRLLRRPDLPLKGLAMLMLGFVLFKSIVLASLGSVLYDQRLAALADGTGPERAGAWMLQADPLTQHLAAWLAPLF